MQIDIKLHKEDLPDQITFSDKIAIDCEMTGLNVERDRLCLVQISSGNNDAHIILRGGKTPNYDNESIYNTLTALKEAEVNESIMIDASHGNSQKKFKQQIPVVESICDQIINGDRCIKGVMIESHLNEGNQDITENLKYGQSITDACLGWDDTLMCLRMLNEAVIKKRGK